MAFINLSKKTKSFLAGMRVHNKDNFKPIAKILTAGTIAPGDVVYFRYSLFVDGRLTKGERIALIVSCDRTQSGIFTSTQGNKLLASFKLDDKDPQVVGFILKTLYKHRRLCNYYKIIAALDVVLGIKEFRTYKTKKAFNVHEFLVDKDTLPTHEEGAAEEDQEPI